MTAIVLSMLAFPCLSAKKPEPSPFNGDLTTRAIKHGAECPLPKARPCIIKKPVGKGYRVLTQGANLEDLGEFWLADLTKLKDPKSNRATLLIWGSNDDLHEIEILFPKEATVKTQKAPQEPATPKEEEKKTPP
ncbi:MAG: hypothetical protein PHQ05_03250 [Sterolibacterium sp.]|nr:hypothetical protein [Sterolibacterium sp.]